MFLQIYLLRKKIVKDRLDYYKFVVDCEREQYVKLCEGGVNKTR